MEEEDVLQLLTGDDEFDADIDADAEEELLREDSDVNASHKHKMETNESIDDEEDDEDRDDGRRGRFKSERIMSLVSVPSRRHEIPDTLESVKVNEKNHQNRSHYNNRRHNSSHNSNPQKYRNSHPNHTTNDAHNRHNNYRQNQGLLPLPQPMGSQPMVVQHSSPLHPQQPPPHPQPPQQRMPLIGPNIANMYGQPTNANPIPNSVNTIHVNPHFRARVPNQFDLSQSVRPLDQPFRPQVPVGLQSRHQFPQQNVNTSQQMLFNPQMNHQMRPQFIGNNNSYNDQTIPQMPPQLRPQQQQQPLIQHPPQQQHNQHFQQMDTQWRGGGNVHNMYPMQHNLGQQLIPQQMSMNRPPNAMMNVPQPPLPQQQQHNFVPNNNHSYNTNYQQNQQLMGGPTQPIQTSHPTHPMHNSYNTPQHYQLMDNQQRFPVQHNYNQIPTLGQQNSQTFQSPPNQQMFNKPNHHNMNQMKPIVNKRPAFQSQSSQERPNRGFGGEQQHPRGTDSMKAAQLRTKRAKQLLTKKQQNIKEVPIVRNIGAAPVVENQQQRANKEIEAAVGVDEEYKKKMEEQKRLREEILRKKEERRKATAAQRLRASGGGPPVPQLPPMKAPVVQPNTAVRPPQQQQIATLLNRSPQLMKQLPQQTARRVMIPTTNTNSKPVLNRVVVNPNQKRSVLIKGLAASTNEMAIRRLCKPIGAIESCKIVTIGGQRSGTVTFMRRQDAVAFQTKYERTLLDLCVIQVSLI